MAVKKMRKSRRPRTKRYSRPLKAVKRTLQLCTATKGVAFKRTFFVQNWAFGTTATTDFWRRFSPRFSDLPNHLEYANLFDEYKITGIKITFHPRFGATNLPVNAANNTVGNNQFYITIANSSLEYELIPSGTYSSATYNTMLEELGSKTRTIRLDKPVSLYFKPNIFEEIGGTTGYGYKHRPCPWLELKTGLSPQMHGMHAFIHDYNFSNANLQGMGVDIQYTFYFQCRGQA